MSTTQAAGHEPGRDEALEHEINGAQVSDAEVSAPRSRRRFLRQALGGAGVLALSASGAVALRRADAKGDDDDDDDDDGGHGGDDNSGSSSGSGSGSGGDDNSGRNGSDDHDDDDHDDDDHDDDDHDDDHDDDDDRRLAGTPVDGVTEIRITDDDEDAFEPQMITVDLGTEVTFFNDDDKDHTATSASFDTGRIEPGESATVTLDEPGAHFYACEYHPKMTGTIFVRDEDGRVPGATAATPRVIEAANAGSETVSIANFAFDPADLTVSAGTTVTWENTDAAPHTATAEDGSFDTGRIDQNATGSVTFDEPGTFAYFCAFHPNMKGTITVE